MANVLFIKLKSKLQKDTNGQSGQAPVTADKPENKKQNHPEKRKPEAPESLNTIKDKTSGRFIEIKSFMGHVIEPEERTLKNYMNFDFWKSKRELYRELREKEKQDQNIYQTLYDGATPTIEYYILFFCVK